MDTTDEFDLQHHANRVALWLQGSLASPLYADAESIPVRRDWLVALLNDRKRLQEATPTHQWRIRIDGYPNSGCWIDVEDGDFQNLNVVGRLEFRAKPGARSENDAASVYARAGWDERVALAYEALAGGGHFAKCGLCTKPVLIHGDGSATGGVDTMVGIRCEECLNAGENG